MPWVDTQRTPYGPTERVWEEGWTDEQLTPYGGKTRVYEVNPGEFLLPREAQNFGIRGAVEPFEGS